MIPNNSTILFQGDSITDCDRSRDAAGIPNDLAGLAQGYAGIAAFELLEKRPADGVHPSAAGHLLMAKCWLEKTASL